MVPAHKSSRICLDLTEKLAVRPRPKGLASFRFLALGAVLFIFGLSSSFALAERYNLPLFVSDSQSGVAKGVLHIHNASALSGMVELYAYTDSGVRLGPATLTVSAWQTVEIDSADLGSGNSGKGLSGGFGAHVGDLRLTMDSELPLVPMALVRASDGTLAAIHDRLSINGGSLGDDHPPPLPSLLFNPASELIHSSRLRLINPGSARATITISARGFSGNGAAGGDIQLGLEAGAARTLTAQELESGGTGLTGAFGTGNERWRLSIESDQPIRVVNLIVTSTTGGYANLSTTALRGHAPEDPESFKMRVADERVFTESHLTSTVIDLEADNRFTSIERAQGSVTTLDGRYQYKNIGPNAGILTLTFDAANPCDKYLYWRSRESGWFANRCALDGDDSPVWTAGSWRIVAADDIPVPNSLPVLASTGTGNRAFTINTAIDTLTLPSATGGDGALSYSLTPSVPGLSFDAATRQLSGTPTEAGNFAVTYSVADADGDRDSLNFTISVLTPDDDGDEVRYCHVNLFIGPGGSCTYPDTEDTFSVNVRGQGVFLRFVGSTSLRIGTTHDLRASNQGDGVWRIDRVAGSSEPPSGGAMLPSFVVSAPSDQVYKEAVAIRTLRLPEGRGGDGTLSYSLTPSVPGLTFDPATRQLTGTPSAAGDYDMVYRVTDADGDSDSLTFKINVQSDPTRIPTEPPPPLTADPKDLESRAEGFRTTEFARNPSLYHMNAHWAYARGLTGEGETLGMVDTGIYAAHEEFAGRLADDTLYTVLTDDSDGDSFQQYAYHKVGEKDPASDYPATSPESNPNCLGARCKFYDYNHGSLMASVAVGARNGKHSHGLAFGAKLQFHPTRQVGTNRGSIYYHEPGPKSHFTSRHDIVREQGDVAPVVSNSWLTRSSEYWVGYGWPFFRVLTPRYVDYQADRGSTEQSILVWSAGNRPRASGPWVGEAAVPSLSERQVRAASGGDLGLADLLLSDAERSGRTEQEALSHAEQKMAKLRRRWLAAVAVNDAGGGASGSPNWFMVLSARCGFASDWCVAAGPSIAGINTSLKDPPQPTTQADHVDDLKTSGAAALASAALTILLQAYRDADGELTIGTDRVLNRLKETANHKIFDPNLQIDWDRRNTLLREEDMIRALVRYSQASDDDLRTLINETRSTLDAGGSSTREHQDRMNILNRLVDYWAVRQNGEIHKMLKDAEGNAERSNGLLALLIRQVEWIDEQLRRREASKDTLSDTDLREIAITSLIGHGLIDLKAATDPAK